MSEKLDILMEKLRSYTCPITKLTFGKRLNNDLVEGIDKISESKVINGNIIKLWGIPVDINPSLTQDIVILVYEYPGIGLRGSKFIRLGR